MVSGILGNFHQGCQVFAPFNGVQCTAIALIALLVFISNPLHDISSPIQLDEILRDGTKLYANLSAEIGSLQYLGHNQLPSSLHFRNNHFTVEYFLDYYYGRVDSRGNEGNVDDFGQMILFDAISQAMLVSSNMLLTLNDITVALHIDVSNNQFVIFDSHQRDRYGLQDAENGAAVLLIFESYDELLSYLHNTYPLHNYELTPVSVVTSHHTHTETNTNEITETVQQHCGNNHTYSSVNNRSKKTKRKGKNQMNENITTLFSNSSNNYNNNTLTSSYDVDMLDVGVVCNVSTEERVKYMDYLEMPFHALEYEEAIRQSPCKSCSCCGRILFENQTFSLSKINDACCCIGVCVNSNLCQMCKNYLKQNIVPNISLKGNNLNTGSIPIELKDLTLLEKKMLSKINIFMSLILLPGGQYAQKGLILNLPVNVEKIIQQFPRNIDQCPFIQVKFENTDGTPFVSNRHKIRSKKYADAMFWLIRNNRHYTNLNFNVHDVVSELNMFHEINENCCSNQEIDELEEAVMIPVNSTNNVSSNPYIHVERSTSKPVNILLTENAEELAFPWLFVNGINGFSAQRPKRITPSMYFKVRLYNVEGHFRKNMTYLLHIAASYNVTLLKQELGIHMKIVKTVRAGNQSFVTAGDIKHINENSELLENSYMFMKNIKGTVAYFRNVLYDLLAIFKSLGPPTLFVTLSADDLHWPELGMTLENLEFKDAFGKSFFHSMRNDPLLTATHFDRRFRALLKHVILGKSEPLGKVLDYFARIEFQNRGSPHVHMFLWIDNLPSELAHDTISEYIDYISNAR